MPITGLPLFGIDSIKQGRHDGHRLQQLCRSARRRFGRTILPFFRTALAIENKKAGGFDPVTAADRAAEQTMRALIRKQFSRPRHPRRGIWVRAHRRRIRLGARPDRRHQIFITGMVAWGTLIGLMRFGEPVFGMMNQPFTRERFSGDGGAAHTVAGGQSRSACAVRQPR